MFVKKLFLFNVIQSFSGHPAEEQFYTILSNQSSLLIAFDFFARCFFSIDLCHLFCTKNHQSTTFALPFLHSELFQINKQNNDIYFQFRAVDKPRVSFHNNLQLRCAISSQFAVQRERDPCGCYAGSMALEKYRGEVSVIEPLTTDFVSHCFIYCQIESTRKTYTRV